MPTIPDLAAAETQHAAAVRTHADATAALANARAKLAEAGKLAADLLARAGAGEPIPAADLVKAQTATREPEAAVVLAEAAERAAAERLAEAEGAVRVAEAERKAAAERLRRERRIANAAALDAKLAAAQAACDALNEAALPGEHRLFIHVSTTPVLAAAFDQMDVRTVHGGAERLIRTAAPARAA